MNPAAKKDLDRQDPGTLTRDRAGMFNFLAALYNQRPDEDFVKNLKGFSADQFRHVFGEEGVSEPVTEGLRAVSRYIASIQDRPVQDIEEELAVDWTRLFRGVQPDYGPTPPYESVYLASGKEDQHQMTLILSELMSIYRQERVVLDQVNANRPDYLGLEFGFLGFLSEKETRARLQGDDQAADEYARKAEKFLRDHPGRWAAEFCKEAERYAETDFYRGVIEITRGVVSEFSTPGFEEDLNQSTVVEVFDE